MPPRGEKKATERRGDGRGEKAKGQNEWRHVDGVNLGGKRQGRQQESVMNYYYSQGAAGKKDWAETTVTRAAAPESCAVGLWV